MLLLLFYLLASFSTVSSQEESINELLRPDTHLTGPGVRARLTPVGTTYVSSVVAKALSEQLPLVNLPNEKKEIKLSSLPSVTFTQFHLNTFTVPPEFSVQTQLPNSLAAHITNITISTSTHARGMIGDVPIDGFMDIRSSRFSIDVTIRISRNNKGNPLLKVSKCQVAPHVAVTVAVQRALTPESGNLLAESIAIEASEMFQHLVCPKLMFIIENRINQRFGLLSTHISLGEATSFDLVRSLLTAENERKKKIRRNSIKQRDAPVMTSRRNFVMPRRVVQNRMVQHTAVVRRMSPQMLRQSAAVQPLMVRSPRNAKLHDGHIDQELKIRVQRQMTTTFHSFLNSFNLSRADSLILNYGMVSSPVVTVNGIEIATSGEISIAHQSTPFGPRPTSLPSKPSLSMLQIVVSDYVPNTLMFHGHRSNLFNTRVDPNTPQFGPVMRTTCDLSTGSLFCVGDLFPTLRDMLPNRGVAFLFSTLQAPAIIVQPEVRGGIKFQLLGLIQLLAIDGNGVESPIGSMEIHLDATMKMKLSSKSVRGKVQLENIQLRTRSPNILLQDELDDAGYLSREILQRMVNDILRQGIPIPVHPLFKLSKPKLTLLDRSMLLETNFQLNQKLINQLTSENLVA